MLPLLAHEREQNFAPLACVVVVNGLPHAPQFTVIDTALRGALAVVAVQLLLQ
jgi:hypothetical protein